MPVIVADTGLCGAVLIDGWHRVRKAMANGILELPCVVVKPEEMQCVSPVVWAWNAATSERRT